MKNLKAAIPLLTIVQSSHILMNLAAHKAPFCLWVVCHKILIILSYVMSSWEDSFTYIALSQEEQADDAATYVCYSIEDLIEES